MSFSLESLSILENTAAVFSIAFVILNARGRILSWPMGIIGSALYVVVFYYARLYADMSLQFFYVLMGIYGWIKWNSGDEGENMEVRKADRKMILKLVVAGIVLTPLTGYFLNNYTNADIPYIDAATTVFSLIATWMMAQKYIQNWVFWIIIDLACVFIYFYKGLNTTVLLFLVYTIMAAYGYYEWNRFLNLHKKNG